MSVVLVLAVLAILAGVVVVAIGRGGELAVFRPDSVPFPREFATAADVAAFRPPPAFLGYSAQATDDALRQIVRAVAQRDAELAILREQVAALRRAAAADDADPNEHDAAGGGDAAGLGGPDAWGGGWRSAGEPGEASIGE